MNDIERILADQFKDNVMAQNWDRALGTLETLQKNGVKFYCNLTTMSYFAEEGRTKFWSKHCSAAAYSEYKDIPIDWAMNAIRIKDIEQKQAKDKEGQLERDFVRALQSKDWKAALNLSDLAQSQNHTLRIRKIDSLPMYSAAKQKEICEGVLSTDDMEAYITLDARLTKECLEAALRQGEQHKQQSAGRAV